MQIRQDGILVQNNSVYQKISYDDECELVRLAVENKGALFGRNIIYVNLRKRLTSSAEVSKYPDGFFLTGKSPSDIELWLVEYELLTHGEKHIAEQIGGFLKALDNQRTRKDLAETIDKEMKSNPQTRKALESVLSAEAASQYILFYAIENRRVGITVVIDEKDDKMVERLGNYSKYYDIPIVIREFLTYRNDVGKLIHLLEPMQNADTRQSVHYSLAERREPLKDLAKTVKSIIESYNRKPFKVTDVNHKIEKGRLLRIPPELTRRYPKWSTTPLRHRIRRCIQGLEKNGKINRLGRGKYKQVKEF